VLVRIFLYVSLFILLFEGFLYLGAVFHYGEFTSFFNALLAVSSMIFTIMGIWIALIYPSALQRIMSSTIQIADFSDDLEATKRLEGLVASVLRSAIVATVIVLIFLVKPIFINFSWALSNSSELMSALVSLAVCMTVLQLESIFHVIVSNVRFINELHSKRESREQDEDT